jgi:NitT/TauT family transport system substrate-binding protein
MITNINNKGYEMFKKIGLMIALLFTINVNATEIKKLDKIVLSGPMASVSHPLFHMIETGAMNDVAKKIEFRLWIILMNLEHIH